MATSVQNPVPIQEMPDVQQTFTFGPFSAASADQILPFTFPRNFVVHGVAWIGRVPGSTGATGKLMKRTSADTTVASTITAARQIGGDMDLANTGSRTTIPYTETIPTSTQVAADYHVLAKGDQLVLDLSGTLTNLADAFITIWGYTRLK